MLYNLIIIIYLAMVHVINLLLLSLQVTMLHLIVSIHHRTLQPLIADTLHHHHLPIIIPVPPTIITLLQGVTLLSIDHIGKVSVHRTKEDTITLTSHHAHLYHLLRLRPVYRQIEPQKKLLLELRSL